MPPPVIRVGLGDSPVAAFVKWRDTDPINIERLGIEVRRSRPGGKPETDPEPAADGGHMGVIGPAENAVDIELDPLREHAGVGGMPVEAIDMELAVVHGHAEFVIERVTFITLLVMEWPDRPTGTGLGRETQSDFIAAGGIAVPGGDRPTRAGDPRHPGTIMINPVDATRVAVPVPR